MEILTKEQVNGLRVPDNYWLHLITLKIGERRRDVEFAVVKPKLVAVRWRDHDYNLHGALMSNAEFAQLRQNLPQSVGELVQQQLPPGVAITLPKPVVRNPFGVSYLLE